MAFASQHADHSDSAKRQAAARALACVAPGMRLGLGTGSTAAHFVDLLGARVREGLDVIGVPTSLRTAEQARALGIPLSDLDETPELDLTVDGADAFDTELRLVKGGGGALLREKIVAAASAHMVVIADGLEACGASRPISSAVEVTASGCTPRRARSKPSCVRQGSTAAGSAAGRGRHALRHGWRPSHPGLRAGEIFRSRGAGGHARRDPGVMGHGLFLGLASAIIIADGSTVQILGTVP